MSDTRVDFFLPLYVRDFLAATIGWTASERGHYMMLLMLQWDRGSLPEDMAGLERLSPGIGESWDLIGQKFPVSDDGLRRNLRLEEHREKALELRRKRAEAGSKGGQSKARAQPKQSQDFARAKTYHPEPEPHISPPPVGGVDMATSGREKTAPAAAGLSVDGRLVKRLLEAWNNGVGARWATKRPPAAAVARLADPEWLEIAVQAIERLPSCKFFQDPVDLVQFCGDGFAERVLGGRYDKRFRSGTSQEDGRPTAEEAAARWARRDPKTQQIAAEFVAAKARKAQARKGTA